MACADVAKAKANAETAISLTIGGLLCSVSKHQSCVASVDNLLPYKTATALGLGGAP
jgi:hypothetical protein